MTAAGLLSTRALEHPNRTAVYTDTTGISYEALNSASTRVGHWLLNHGLRPGDRLAIHWHNSYEAVLLYYAAFKAGIVAVPVNLRLKAPEIAYIFQHSTPSLCFSAPELAPVARAAAASCSSIPLVREEIPSEPQTGNLPSVEEAQTAAILYTSGTTAHPKGVELTHGAFVEICKSIRSEVVVDGGPGICMTPIVHIAALSQALGSIAAGVGVVLLPGFDPGRFLDAIERHGCTSTMALPSLLQFVLAEQSRHPRNLSSLRTVLAGGDKAPSSLHRQFSELLGFPLQEYYGLTEAGCVSVNPKHAVREGSMGLPLAVLQVRVVDVMGNDVPRGEAGEVLVRSPMMGKGYWNDPEATRNAFRDGWFHTGDLAAPDPGGYLWFRGRAKQIIVRGGSNVSPQEVEEVLCQHPAVREAGVVGRPEPKYGEVVVAFLVLHRPVTTGDEADIREFARTRLADYKTPERIIFRTELPKGLTGKVDRRTLRESLLSE